MERKRLVDVYACWLKNDIRIGTLYGIKEKGPEKYSFQFDNEWLIEHPNIFLDPDLAIQMGRQFTPYGKKIFGMFSDCAPDRWGRVLLERKERILAEEENRSKKPLNELDYILGITDESRVGGLRFKIQDREDYVSTDLSMAIPPFEDLRTLENASIEYEKNANPKETKWLKLLVSPASSLGGARPKATVKDVDGTIWVAKFPSKKDEYNVGAWEYTVNKLARMCGLNTTETKIQNFSKYGSTFLSKRFDREYTKKEVKRIHYASSMTVLGKTDGAGFEDGTGYLDIAEFIKMNSIQPDVDLEELWNRIFFNYCITNTDDHLRNHGFLLTEQGWKLSPLFDINPNPMGTYSALSLDSNGDNELNKKTIIDTAYYYGLNEKKVKENVERISQVVNDNWRQIAKISGISQSEINEMEYAFKEK